MGTEIIQTDFHTCMKSFGMLHAGKKSNRMNKMNNTIIISCDKKMVDTSEEQCLCLWPGLVFDSICSFFCFEPCWLMIYNGLFMTNLLPTFSSN